MPSLTDAANGVRRWILDQRLARAQTRLMHSVLPNHPDFGELSEEEVLSTLERLTAALPPGSDLEHDELLGGIFMVTARTTTHPKVQHFLLDLELGPCVRQMAHNKSLDGAALERLFDMPGVARGLLAEHPRITRDLAWRIATRLPEDEGLALRASLAGNPGTPPDVAEHLFEEAFAELESAASAKPSPERNTAERDALWVLQALGLVGRLSHLGTERLLGLGTVAAGRAALCGPADPAVQLLVLSRCSSDFMVLSDVIDLPVLEPEVLEALLANPLAAPLLARRRDLPVPAQQGLAALEDAGVDSALVSSSGTDRSVLESVLKRTPATSTLWDSYEPDGGSLLPREWMPVPFLHETFPAFLEDLATKRGLDHETIVDLSPRWEGSLDELLKTALDLGPDDL